MSCGNDDPNVDSEDAFRSDSYHWGHPLAEEIYLSLRTIQDPEKPYTLEELDVVYPEGIRVTCEDGKEWVPRLAPRGNINGDEHAAGGQSSRDAGGCCGGGATCSGGTAAANGSASAAEASEGYASAHSEATSPKSATGGALNLNGSGTTTDANQNLTANNFGDLGSCGHQKVHPPQLESAKANARFVEVTFKPTSPVCSLATLIGLAIMHKLREEIPTVDGFPKVGIQILEGSHNSGEAVTKQLNDKERRYAAMENPDIAHAVKTACRLEGDYDD
mmetsp:Transcript_11027/g.26979  ORF Transcript_11027/g.26979 Transcript_11027/m.26979 type:complete len:276 (+) Transcript_11027:169-996(+)|eukprot:CAMPEP_0178984994 /NCGR_PEP_ID=MMETSP0795-20121207/1915_1 /TAXON_ID=88552 /ORGANISM="Amoebophrya sp., Strain Ameob2" /LENGTH=275 /DNA_ID=CAMNT_0020675921 /DNA_START=118 /DNA_END=945 /DNA_ORIENTATION=-